MAQTQNFRSAFNGFNREDVVEYIEYLNNHYAAQLRELQTELQNAQNALAEQRPASPMPDEDTAARLAAAEEKCAALERELAEARACIVRLQAEGTAAKSQTDEELAAYRRAERMERLTRERAVLVTSQLNAAIAQALAKLGEAAGLVSGAAERTSAQIRELQMAVNASKAVLRDASAAVEAIEPTEVKE